MGEIAELHGAGAKPQPNSGRGKHRKGDGILEPFCVDVKERGKSMTLDRKTWAKICTDAIEAGNLEPALLLVIGETAGEKVRLVTVGQDMFEQMREAWVEKYGTE